LFFRSQVKKNQGDLTTLSDIGIPVSKMDRRMYLDAFFEIINIQKILFYETLFIIEEVPRRSIFSYIFQSGIEVKDTWKKFAERLQQTIQSHLNTIREVAESLHYGRHLLLAKVEMLESDVNMLIFQLKYPPDGVKVVDVYKKLKIKQKCEEIKQQLIPNIKMSDEYLYVDKEFKNGLEKKLVDLIKICNEICSENSNNTLSIVEKLEIHRIKFEFEYDSPGMYDY